MRILKKKNVILVYVICLALMVFGSFFDEQISGVLYNQSNLYGVGMASFGEFPFLLSWWIGGTIALHLYQIEKKKSYLFLTAFSYLFGCVVFAQPVIHLPFVNAIIGIVIEAILGILCSRWIYQNLDTTNVNQLKSVMQIILGVAFAQVLIINVVKIPWGRPRYRTLIKVLELEFTPWWKPGVWDKDWFSLLGIASEEFKSFPSGHTGDTASIFSLIYLTRVIPQFKDKEKLFTCISIVWVMCMMVSRIIMGAHFLTDVTMGFVITFTSFVIIANYCDDEKSSAN